MTEQERIEKTVELCRQEPWFRQLLLKVYEAGRPEPHSNYWGA